MTVLEWGYPLILWTQNLGDWLLLPMQVFTAMGNEMFFMLVMPIFLWSFDAYVGLEVGLLLLFSSGLNAVAKMVVALPRPFWVNPAVRVIEGSSGFGFPSGHAQNAFVMWGQIALRLRQRLLKWICVALVLLISISRWYLGLHFPTDTFAGWVIAAMILLLYNRYGQPVLRSVKQRSIGMQITLCLIVAVILAAAGWLTASLRVPPAALPSWERGALAALPDSEPITPFNPEAVITSAGAWFGLAAGGVLLAAWGGYCEVAKPVQNGARIVLGLGCLLGIQFGLDALFPSGPSLAAAVFRFLRYSALGFWISYLAPRLFMLLKLHTPSSAPSTRNS